MSMLYFPRIAMLAAVMLCAAALPVRAQTASADDTAKFLAGMIPSADSPLTPLTNEAAWQRPAKFFASLRAAGSRVMNPRPPAQVTSLRSISSR